MNIRQIIQRFQKESAPTPELLMQMAGIRERNEERLVAIKEEMGTKWILHPCHKKSKLDEPRPV